VADEEYLPVTQLFYSYIKGTSLQGRITAPELARHLTKSGYVELLWRDPEGRRPGPPRCFYRVLRPLPPAIEKLKRLSQS
jgi:hypothetical protein